MRKTILFLYSFLYFVPNASFGQSYTTLWKQMKAAEDKDQPRTMLGIADKIATKAEAEGDYGQLLKATVKSVALWGSISGDSVKPAVDRLVEKEKRAGSNIVLRSVYDASLYRLYKQYKNTIDDADKLAAKYCSKALERPDLLASAKTSAYEPFVVEGVNSSSIFNDDLLSVVGYETGQYDRLHAFYSGVGNRRAACIVALETLKLRETSTSSRYYKKSRYIQSLDSLISEYQDLDVAGEVAVERYNAMDDCTDVTVEDRIKYIHYALDKWGAWQRMGELRNNERMLTSPTFSVYLEKGLVASKTQQTVLFENLRNIEALTMNVYRTTLDGDSDVNPQETKAYKQLKPQLTLLPEMTRTRKFNGQPDYQVFNDSVSLGGLPVGVYMLEFVSSPIFETRRMLYRVSDLYTISQPQPDGQMRYVVVNATTGQPIAGAKLRLTTRVNGKKKTTTLTTDSQGEATYKKENNSGAVSVYAFTDGDRASIDNVSYDNFYYNESNRRSSRTTVFTDRSIYRPGQTVHVAAIVYTTDDGISYNAETGKSVKATLRDANYKIVDEKTLTTDSYGKCSVDFTLPTGKLTGRYTVNVNGLGSASFNVEEYKRPTFKVEFPDISEKYDNGDTLLVKGKAVSYAGVPVQGAKVKYAVKRSPALWWLRCPWNGDMANTGTKTMIEGEAVTDSEGQFIVEMPMILPDENIGSRAFYNFVATADVTDNAGETHSGELSVPLGSRTAVLTSSLTPQVLTDSVRSVTFNLRNAAGHDVSADVRFRLDGKGEWLSAKTTEAYTFPAKISSGKHSLMAICENDTLRQDFVAFSLDDTELPTVTDDWFYVSSQSFPSDGSPVTVQIGSSADSVHVVYAAYAGKKLLASGAKDESNSMKNFKIKYQEAFGDGLLLTMAWVKNGKCYTHETTIKRPLPDKQLKMEWTTFRDRLTPGQKEEWTLRIVKPDSRPADASLTATLYDQSLDQLKKHSWSFGPQPFLRTPNTQWLAMPADSKMATSVLNRSYLQSKNLDLSHFDDDVFEGIYAYGELSEAVPMMSRSMKIAGGTLALHEAVLDEAKVFNSVDKGNDADQETASTKAASDQLRENLNETAFFYPTLQTNANGNVSMKFTLPESLTTWSFIGLANTADMMYGQLTGEAVAQKPVMVQPNVPRFIRTGDKAQISTRISNTTASTMSGTARMTLSDPETEKTVYTKDIPFTVEAGKTTAVTFDYQPDGTTPLLVCKITASGRGFSDGEQHYLPILPDRERVTVTVPFTQNRPGTKTVDVAKLFPKGAKADKLTVEYTNNPAWLVVQTLPYVATASDDNAISQATSLYANTIGQSIANSSPKIKQVFEQWKQDKSDATSLASALVRNEELKDIALDETPWVADADRETEQKMRMVDFFDDNTMQNRIASATAKLASLQNSDGSWSWWKGMDGSTYMTTEVATMLARMNLLTGSKSETMLNNAMAYLDKRMTEMVDKMKSEEKKGHKQTFPDMTALQYLYINSISGRTTSASARTAQTYLIALLKKETKKQSIYEKALSAVVFAKNGSTALASDYAKSLKEYLVSSEEMGSYYDTPKAEYSWYDYKIPSHVAAMEAIETVTPGDTATADGMRRWLLQEKRTQAWDTPINTANAVYAFMHGNVKTLANQEQAVFSLDGKTLDTPKATAGIGYVKTAVSNPSAKTFTARKSSQGTSWGAVYAQFMQKSSDISSSNSAISLKREIISEEKELKVGDRVKVRITVEAKRDLDFVQVIDRRAACMEPVNQLSGYHYGYYCTPKDNTTNYYFDRMAKGRKVVIETEYYIDRAGEYETGTCTAGCAYAPEYRATAKTNKLRIKN